MSESANSSLNEDLVEMAASSGIEGLSDTELETEINNLSNTYDGDATVREVTTPQTLKSVVVVPNKPQRTLPDLIPQNPKQFSNTPDPVKTFDPRYGPKSKVQSQKTRLVKRSKKIGKGKASAVTLTSMFAGVNFSDQKSAPNQSTPKRLRSPGSENSGPQNPEKFIKLATQPPFAELKVESIKSYSEIVQESLKLKISPANKTPNDKLVASIRTFILATVEKSIEEDIATPILRESHMGKDGFYVFCSDLAGANWYKSFEGKVIPGTDTSLTVLPYNQAAPSASFPKPARIVVTLATRRSNAFILKAIARLNSDLDTREWRIVRRMAKGKRKDREETLLFMRIDIESFRRIMQRNMTINWSVGPAVVELERQKPRNDRIPSRAIVATASGIIDPGSQTAKPSASAEVLGTMANPTPSGRSRVYGPDGKGQSKNKQ